VPRRGTNEADRTRIVAGGGKGGAPWGDIIGATVVKGTSWTYARRIWA
jgi:hypothetical protein